MNVAEPVERNDGVVQVQFWCPGCEMYHAPQVGKNDSPRWEWNGSYEKPTFSPSLLVQWEYGDDREKRRCHSFVTDGKIRFLRDCTHDLAGEIVPLESIDK